MSDIQKTIKILEEIPEDISTKISMKELFEIFSIMLSMNEDNAFEPTIDDFTEALYIRRIGIEQGLKDIEEGNVYTTEELKKELGI